MDATSKRLPILPLRSAVAFPFVMMPLSVGIPRSIKLIEDAFGHDNLIGLITSRNPEQEEPTPGQLHAVGCMARIHRLIRGHHECTNIVVEGLERFKVVRWEETMPYLCAQIVQAPELFERNLEMDALMQSLRELAAQVVALSFNAPQEVGDFLCRVDDPRKLLYAVASNTQLSTEQSQYILELDQLKDKYHVLINHLARYKEVLELGLKIKSEAEEQVGKAQREYILRQQLKAIQKELGETDEHESEAAGYTRRIEDCAMPEEARKEARQEVKRMAAMTPQSAEYAVIKTYLDWLLDLPWNIVSQDCLDIQSARKVLDEDHYDLGEIKDRIIEYLAVRKLIRERDPQAVTAAAGDGADQTQGVILCFVGPPGVGKTSLGQSIARALGRKFTRMSLGGMRDEAEIRGHRRTYIGAMPGRILQAIKRAGTRNPVFMLDEVDKIGTDWRGDPASALLEVLDPAQNHTFRDHYLDVDFNLSDVMFITTANKVDTIPPPLRDRMETITLDGYASYEKIHIAKKFLVPRQIKASGLHPAEVIFSEEALSDIIQNYTREAGVRTLERLIGSICRKVVVQIAADQVQCREVTTQAVRIYLKKERFHTDLCEPIDIPGIAIGLAVTAAGGDIIYIEATRMTGSGQLTLTGHLGDVMRESAQIAHSYVKSKAGRLGIDPSVFKNADVHLHVPAGAIPKDGPSSGIAMVAAIAGLFSRRPVRGDIGMTGEITLRGRVLPVGGIKMKILAAHRAGLKTVILPRKNAADLEDLPDNVRGGLNFMVVDRIDEALDAAFAPSAGEQTMVVDSVLNG